MSKHTPGPWELDDNQGSRDYITINAPTHGALASVVWQMEDDKADGRRSPACEANAHLISSAPDLLDALQAILDAGKIAGVFGPFDEIGKIPAALYREGRTAIAKAKGEAV